jgi:hypothetical protein
MRNFAKRLTETDRDFSQNPSSRLFILNNQWICYTLLQDFLTVLRTIFFQILPLRRVVPKSKNVSSHFKEKFRLYLCHTSAEK